MTLDVVTENVGFRGAFVRMAGPPPLRQLVKLTLLLPKGEQVELHGMIVHMIDDGSERAGFGVQFWSVDAKARASWEHFVHGLLRESHARARAAQSS